MGWFDEEETPKKINILPKNTMSQQKVRNIYLIKMFPKIIWKICYKLRYSAMSAKSKKSSGESLSQISDTKVDSKTS